MSTTIYILRLEGGRYYIGKTTNVIQRYQEHLNGEGSTWTRKYRPISLVKTIETASPFDEDKVTKEYMSKYGIDKVRGGSYVSENLDEVQHEAIEREIRGATDCCTNCGKKGHFIKDCYSKNTLHRTSVQVTRPVSSTCYRCGREGHYSINCYARSSVKGYEIDDSDSEYDSECD